MAAAEIATCPGCGSWASLRDGRCSQCRAAADLARFPRDRLLTVPISLLASGLPPKVRCLASAGFGVARIAELLDTTEADVRLILEAGG